MTSNTRPRGLQAALSASLVLILLLTAAPIGAAPNQAATEPPTPMAPTQSAGAPGRSPVTPRDSRERPDESRGRVIGDPEEGRPAEPGLSLMSTAGRPLLAPFSWYQTWFVTGGYNSGPCHSDPNSCGDPYSETYSFDMVPEGRAACGAYVYSPAPGKITWRRDSIGAGLGGGVGIQLSDGSVVFLKHIRPASFTEGVSTVAYHTYLGTVNCGTSGGDHLHLQHNRADKSAIPNDCQRQVLRSRTDVERDQDHA